jgi:hypothetical protein
VIFRAPTRLTSRDLPHDGCAALDIIAVKRAHNNLVQYAERKYVGITSCCSARPLNVMRKYRFEQLWFVSMLVGLVFIPWAATLLLCPEAIEACRQIDRSSVDGSAHFSLKILNPHELPQVSIPIRQGTRRAR